MDDGPAGPNRDFLHERPDERLRLGDLALHQELAHLPGVVRYSLHVLHVGPAQGQQGAGLIRRLLQPLLVLQMMPDAREYLLGGQVRLLDQLPEAVHAPADVGEPGICCLDALLLLPDDRVHLLVDQLDQVAHVGLGEDVLPDLVDDEALEALRVESRGGAFAASAMEERLADIVGVAPALGLCGGEGLAAGLAGEETAEEVGARGAAGVGDLRGLGAEHLLHPLELPLRDDGGEGVLDADRRRVVLGCGSPDEGSRVCLVAEHPVDSGLHPALAVGRGDSLAVEGLGDVEDARAAEGHGEDAPDDGVEGRVEFQDGPRLGTVLDVNLPVAVGGLRGDPETARCRLPHAAHNLLGKVLAVELVHGLDDGLHELAGGRVVSVLGDGDDAVAPERREAWVAEQVQRGIDVLICHPRLVQTGLDLIDFPTLCWFETDYSVYTMRQASRRSWRIGQNRPVRVVFMAYRNSLQADALKLVAKKLQSSLAVEGELPEDGLAAYGDDGDDLMLALARKIVNGDEDEAETVEAVFAAARDAESAAEEYLVDDGWKAVEPEPVVFDAGRSEAEPEESAPASRGPDDEAQQALFSWAEFMADGLVKPKGRSRKPQPASLSMFEWALGMERERETELVTASG